jgi:tape measure domain-containing protein
MSTTVDQRVVEMQFDNRHFEQNDRTSMTTLERLKQSLNLTGAAKGFDNINNSINRVNFDGFTNGINAISTRFSYLQATIQHQLNNIVDSAVNAGKRMISALTVDPIKTGFSEYETQINSVQTILANTSSKGSTLQDVNRALDTLNTYADKTIYNFTEMTRNIGTFTAAGVDLDTSVRSIQGIANLAAISGSTSQQASNAMYQLSQALAAGRVSLMDWNSVVNAGMGGQVFQDALKRTAKNMGIVVDESKSFRESISGGDTWLSSEVLTKTLEQFTMAAEEGSDSWEKYKKSLMDEGYSDAQATEILKMANTATDAATKVKTFTQLWDTLKESAQSGWTQTWEIVVGDFGEAKKMLTEISDSIGSMLSASAENRNKMLTEGLSSGWKQLMSAGIADEEGYKESIKAIAKEHNVAFDERIKKGEEAGKSFEDVLSDAIKRGEITPDILSESVTHLADSMRNMTEEEFEAAGYTKEYLEDIEALEKGLKKGEISMDEFADKMSRLSGRENLIQAAWNAFNALLSIMAPIKKAFQEIFPPMTGEQLYKITEKIRELTEGLGITASTAEKINPTFENIKRTFKGVFALINIGVKILSALFQGFGRMAKYISPASKGLLDFTARIGDFLVALDESLDKSDFFVKAIEKIGDFLKPIGDGVKSFGKSIKDSLVSIGGTAKLRLEPLTVLANFIKGVFVGLGNLIAKIIPTFSKLAKAAGDAIGNLADGFASIIQGADYNKFFDIFNSGVFAAIGVFIAKFMKSTSGILDDAQGFTEGIQELLGGVGDALNAFTGSLKADTLKKIATAIAILAAALLVLSFIDSSKLAGSLAAITVLFAELSAIMWVFSKMVADKGFASKLVSISATLVSISAAMLLLAVATKILSTMSWSEMGVGLISITVGLGALIGALWLMPEGKFNSAAKAMKKMGTALIIFAVAMKILGSLSWGEVARGLTATVIGLGALVGALHLLPKNTAVKASGVLVLSAALIVLGAALKILATMSWGEIARSLVALGGSLLILAGAMALMRGAIPGAAALLIVTAALAILAPILKLLGSMSWGEIGRGLTALAGAFVVIGVAGLLLQPLIPTLLGLAAAVTLFGIGVAAIGAGITLIGVGITALATALAASGAAIAVYVSSVHSLIPYMIEQIGIGLIKFCEVIAGSSDAICKAVTVIVLALVEALVACVPAIVDGLYVLITEILQTLVEYAPMVVTALYDFLIACINAVAEKLPDLIQAGVNLLMAFFQGVIDALAGIDPSVLINGILAVRLLASLVVVMAAIAALTPAAMIGVIGVGLVVTELALVLAAIGALAQIPGLEWLIDEGGDFLQKVGTAIGKFLGGITGGFASGVSSELPQIADDLSSFMDRLTPFIDGLKSFDDAAADGAKSLLGVILAITAAEVLDGLTSWITGGSSLTQFGDDIAAFGPKLKEYADAVTGIDSSVVESSVNAAKALSELANHLPNSGGVAGFFAGNNDIGTFGEQLVPFGEGMKSYSDAITGFNPEAVIASANAAKALADMTSYIPNSGGVVAWFTGDNSVASFGEELVTLGESLSKCSATIKDFNAEAVIASANAAKAIADMTSHIPNEGGVVAWFTGDNSIANFGSSLVALGEGLLSFSTSVTGISIESITAAAGAAKELALMTTYIPNDGGMKAWFSGETSLANFAYQLPILGRGLLGFSTAVAGLNIEAITAASNAAKTIAQMTEYIPNSGGVIAWFTGDNSIANFAFQLPILGRGLASFSTSVAEVNAENVTNAANAAKVIAEMTSYIPVEGGLKAWLNGDSSIASFAYRLPALGAGIAGFSTAVAEVNAEKVTAAANAAKVIAEMTSFIPNEGGIKAWFTGDSSIANFADKLPALGDGIQGFSDAVSEVNTEAVVAGADAATKLAQMASTTPEDTTKLVLFGDNLVLFADDISAYYEKVGVIGADTVNSASTAIESINTAVGKISPGTISSASKAITDLIKSVKQMAGVTEQTTSGFNAAMKKLGETNVTSIISAYNQAGPKLVIAGKTLMDKFITGAESKRSAVAKAAKELMDKFIEAIEGKTSDAKKACSTLVESCVDAVSNSYNDFYSAGSDLVDGFVAGISDNISSAAEAAASMAEAAVAAARANLQINSPSKVFRAIGTSVPEGFAQGIGRLGHLVRNASAGMTDTATATVTSAVSRIADAINTDIDSNPTIRPVLDLSDVQSGAGAIGGMFGDVGMTARIDTISSMMNGYNQNGGNSMIVSAIDKLRKDLGNIGGTSYNINGITYDDGSNVANAIEEIARAALRERRM